MMKNTVSNRVNKRHRTAFTLTEMMVTMIASLIVVSSLGVIFVDSHTGWNKMYNRVYSDVVTDAYAAKRAFNAIVRKSSVKLIGDNWLPNEVTVYYYQDPNSVDLDRTARFHITNGELRVDYGILSTTSSSISTFRTITLAHNAKSVSFSVNERSIRMVLELDNGREALTVTCSAFRHNM